MTCCGQVMTRDGGQLVCGKCGGWFDGFLRFLTGGVR
jgi:hypothetical protein